MTIVEGEAADLGAVRALFRAYAASLPFSLDYQGFADELAGLPEPYTAPRGCLLLAVTGGVAVGVVAVKPLAAEIAELKRLYVMPAARRQHIGQVLIERALSAAAARGYRRARLDTHRTSMSAAIALNRRLGFVETAPYGPIPDGAFAFFEKRLDANPPAEDLGT